MSLQTRLWVLWKNLLCLPLTPELVEIAIQPSTFEAFSGKDVIVLGASPGGVEALAELVSYLPADLAAALFIVLHIPPHGASVLPGILSRQGPLPARHPADGERVQRGQISVAPPDHH